jgi:hypothetical protein
MCRLIEDLPDYVNGGSFSGTLSWDMKAIASCVCDGGYTGADCSQRICPYGDDPMTVCEEGNTEQIQEVKLSWVGNYAASSSEEHSNAVATNSGFALRFTSYAGESFYTDAFAGFSATADTDVVSAFAATGTAAAMESALEGLPNSRVKDVTVTATAFAVGGASADQVWQVTFHHEDSGNSYGEQELLACPHSRTRGGVTTFGCGVAGCQPIIKQPYVYTLAQSVGGTDTNAVSSNAYSALTGTLGSEFAGTATTGYMAKFTADSVLSCPATSGCAGSATTATGYVTVYFAAVGTAEVAIFVKGGAGSPGADTTLVVAGVSGYTFFGYVSDLTSNTLDIGQIMPDTRLTIASSMTFSAVNTLDSTDGAARATLVFNVPQCTSGADITNGSGVGFKNIDSENVECSGRGECDRKTGLCACFSGYHGNNCGKQTVLV